MKPIDPLLNAWEQILSARAAAPAIWNALGHVSRTFAQIEEKARIYQSKFEEFAPGSVVAAQIGNHADWPSIFIGCLRSNLVLLPLEQSINPHQRSAVLQVCRVSIIASGGRDRTPDAPSDGDIELESIAPSARPLVWGEFPPSLLKLTSGTTATPRVVRFRSEQLLADCEQICRTMGISDADINLGVIPLSHSYGFSNLLTSLIARGVPMVLSSDRTPRAVLDAMARTKATVFPGMPLFYQAFCEMKEMPPLPGLRLCISAGARLPLVVAKQFRERFNLPVHSFYGASECGGICYDRTGDVDLEGFVGTPLEKVDLQIVDRNAESSRIQVRSAAVGDGYFPEPDTEKLSNGVFLPDDVLIQRSFGFQIVGRMSDVINVAGKKVNPAEVEAQVSRFPGIRQAVVFGRESQLRNEEVALCVVAERNVRESDLLEFCRTTLSGSQVPKRVFFVSQIPVNERGKISRRELARHFRDK